MFVWSFLAYAAGLGTHPRMEELLGDFGWHGTVRDHGGISHELRRVADAALQNLGEPRLQDELPVLQLDIKHKHWMKLAEKRAAAFEYGLLVTGDDDEVPASIRFQGRTVRAKIRLKGDMLDHLRGDDWSFRVKIKDGDEILGRRIFSLQHPRTRRFHWDNLFMDEVRRQGVLAVRHDYVRLVVNGDDHGVTDLEDHFSKEMLEAQGRREGVILALEDELFWDWRMAGGGLLRLPEFYPKARSFRPGKIAGSPVLQEMDEVAKGLLRGFFEGRLRAGDVFDPPTWGRLMAVSEVWDFVHHLLPHNVRFYYNPVHGRIEPIAFDCMPVYVPSRTLVRAIENYVLRKMLEDERIRGEFMAALAELRQLAQTPEYLDCVRAEDRRYRGLLHADFPLVRPYWVETIRRRAKELERVTMENCEQLRQVAAPFPEPATAMLVQRDGKSYLELVGQTPGGVRLDALLVDDGTGLREVPGALDDVPEVLHEAEPPRPRVPVRVPLDRLVSDAEELVLRGRESGRGTRFETRAQPYPPAADRPVLASLSIAELGQRLPFAVFEPDVGELIVPPGEWAVSGENVLPEGVGLRICAGVTLRFGEDSNLIVRGPCTVGEPGGAPVRLCVDPAAQQGWQGIAVLRSSTPCQWHNVTVADTAGVRLRGLPLTGAVTFYQTEVYLWNCRFERTQAEDALNLVECSFSFNGITFNGTRSDAFDSDFSKGTLRGGSFEHVGGDGVDFSGSTVEVCDTVFLHIGDKAISVGERSVLDVHDVTIEDSGTAAVAKDGSRLKLRDAGLRDIRHVAVMAYVKKPEFGPGSVECERVTVVRAERDYLAQSGSHVIVDGVERPAEEVDIEGLYATGYMKK